jgi:hypothetical protein
MVGPQPPLSWLIGAAQCCALTGVARRLGGNGTSDVVLDRSDGQESKGSRGQATRTEPRLAALRCVSGSAVEKLGNQCWSMAATDRNCIVPQNEARVSWHGFSMVTIWF